MFNTMKLQDPVIEFKISKGLLCPKSIHDHRWYNVQGITKTLDSIMPKRNRSHGHNMIIMDLYAKISTDLNANPESTLYWLVQYMADLNVPRSKARSVRNVLLGMLRSNSLSFEACRGIWDTFRLSTCIGIAVDGQCKDVYNGKIEARHAGPVSRLILTQLEALRLSPICGGLKVAGIPTPDRFCVPGAYTFHNNCRKGCKSLRGTWGFYTEVDLVARDTVTNNIVLLEIKTRSNDYLDRVSLWRYNMQLWLTWIMFSLTYPSVAERTAAYLVIIRPGTSRVSIRSCLRPTISKSVRVRFPWLNCLCPQVLNCLAPMCVNMRVATRLAQAALNGKEMWLDPNDLCYRNMRFNEDKRLIVKPWLNPDRVHETCPVQRKNCMRKVNISKAVRT